MKLRIIELCLVVTPCFATEHIPDNQSFKHTLQKLSQDFILRLSKPVKPVEPVKPQHPSVDHHTPRTRKTLELLYAQSDKPYYVLKQKYDVAMDTYRKDIGEYYELLALYALQEGNRKKF